ncbi:MAG TPA: MFS transporter [Rhodospirillales bacterium]|nr:MFS transporter [Rhodospirillales bacterium]
MTVKSEYKNVGLLFGSQAMFMTNQVVLITLSGLVGQMLASDKSLATLPVSTVVVATALTTIPASLLMKRVGRRTGFMIGTTIGLIGVLMSIYAIWIASFWMFVTATFTMGINGGFSQYYRFAAAEVASEDFKSRAISLVISGGIAAGVIGPFLVRQTNDMFATPFIGSYIALLGVGLVTFLFLLFLSVPKLTEEDRQAVGRPLSHITRASAFIIAAMTAAIAYAVMSLIMTATPIAMYSHGFDVPQSSSVIQWHVMAMFVPSLFTGSLIHRFGTLKIMFSGLVLLLGCVALAVNGVDLFNFTAALFILGLGWNFAFIGASTLLTETYRPAERAKVQATNDFLVFGTVAAASLSSGVLLNAFDWNTVNYFALPFLAVTIMVVLWYGLRSLKAPA